MDNTLIQGILNDSRFLRLEEEESFGDKESLFCHSIVPVSTSSLSASLPGLWLTFTRTPVYEILTTQELFQFNFLQRAMAGTYSLTLQSTNTTSKLLRRVHTIKVYDQFLPIDFCMHIRGPELQLQHHLLFCSSASILPRNHTDVVTIENPILNLITIPETTSVLALPRKDLAHSLLILCLVERRGHSPPRLRCSNMAWSFWDSTASRAHYI
ncbi:hypothetical protein F5146DRAFT_1004317 [Armillaria mellea]|nr:hypothetical protein F5146DRAFT_1004317 [Armillaria mellea]